MMVKLAMGKMLSYQHIKETAKAIAANYRKEHQVPSLPDSKQLDKYKEILSLKFGVVANNVKEQMVLHETWQGHGYEHLVEVALLAGYLVDREHGDENVIAIAVLAGLFHDIERWRGFGEDHMIEGEKLSRNILEEVHIDHETIDMVAEVVRNHDHLSYVSDNEIVNTVYGAVFDADHFRYGYEREDTFWDMKEKKGVLPELVIHDYQFLPPLKNAWKTAYGKEIGPKLIDFGMAIALGVEKEFRE